MPIVEYDGGGLPTTGRHLVKFYNFTCGPCKAVDAELRRGVLQDGVESTVSVDMFEHPDLVKQYGVRSVPTVFLVEDGEVAGVGTGAHALRALQEARPDLFKPINEKR
jgi:thioredoxin-like negative regulator of GroEL